MKELAELEAGKLSSSGTPAGQPGMGDFNTAEPSAVLHVGEGHMNDSVVDSRRKNSGQGQGHAGQGQGHGLRHAHVLEQSMSYLSQFGPTANNSVASSHKKNFSKPSFAKSQESSLRYKFLINYLFIHSFIQI